MDRSILIPTPDFTHFVLIVVYTLLTHTHCYHVKLVFKSYYIQAYEYISEAYRTQGTLPTIATGIETNAWTNILYNMQYYERQYELLPELDHAEKVEKDLRLHPVINNQQL